MAYIAIDNDLHRCVMFQYKPEMKERYTTKGNQYFRFEDKYGGLGVSMPFWFVDFLKEHNIVEEVSENIFSIKENLNFEGLR